MKFPNTVTADVVEHKDRDAEEVCLGYGKFKRNVCYLTMSEQYY